MYLNSWTIYPINKEKLFRAQIMNGILRSKIWMFLLCLIYESHKMHNAKLDFNRIRKSNIIDCRDTMNRAV